MYEQLEQIARTEHTDVVIAVQPMGRQSDITVKLRMIIRDGSYVDVHFFLRFVRDRLPAFSG